jgi:uncharacterized protein YyaL (SSP411 family)
LSAEWAEAVRTLIAAIGGGLAVAWYQARGHERAYLVRRREHAAEVASSMIQFYYDLPPGLLLETTTSDNYAQMSSEVRSRFAAIRAQLWALSVSYPAKDVRKEARSLLAQLNGYVRDSLMAVQVQLRLVDGDEDAGVRAFERSSTEVSGTLGELMKAIERD